MTNNEFFIFPENWSVFKNLKEDLALLENLLKDFSSPHLASFSFSPNVDVYEKDNNLVVEVDLPGFRPEDIEIEIKNNNLIIRGETKEEKERKEKNFWQKERKYGKIQRTINLPLAVNEEKAEAEFKDGVLKIILPKKEEDKGKKINIKKEK